LKQGIELRRERTIAGKTTIEVAYAATSLSADEADATKLLALIRDHWRIENELHYVRDVTLGEDACRVRTGAAPQVLAALRNAVVHLLCDVDAESRPAAIERLQAHPDEAKQLIGLPQRE
jgi:predicted transposase YbfD/YdcC